MYDPRKHNYYKKLMQMSEEGKVLPLRHGSGWATLLDNCIIR
jgi:hypothetical protein